MSSIVRATSPEVPEPQPGTWSNCLVVDGIAYFAGATSRGEDEYVQAKGIFTKIKHLVEAAGGSMADILKVTIFVTDIKNREKVWRARQEFFTGNFPASPWCRSPRWRRPNSRSRSRPSPISAPASAKAA